MNRIYQAIFVFGLHKILQSIQSSQAHVDIYLTANRTTGLFSNNVDTTCNSTGLLSESVNLINQKCDREPVTAWIGIYANYSLWVEFAGCGIINTTSKLLGGNFTKGPNIEECRKICNYYSEERYNLNLIYMSMSNATCYCFYKTDINLTQCHNQLSSCGKEAFCHEDINVTYGSTIPIYRTNSSFMETYSTSETMGRCSFINITGSTQTRGPMVCSRKASILCTNVSSSEVTEYPTQISKWKEAVMFCLRQDKTLTSISHLGLNQNLTERIYWLSSIRDVFFLEKYGGENSTDTYCIASKIQDDTKIEPIVTNCSTSLPWACIATRDQDRTKCVYTTIQTEDTSVTIKPSDEGMEKFLTTFHIILIVSGGLGLVLLILFIVVMCKCWIKTTKQKVPNEPLDDENVLHVNPTYGKVETKKNKGKKKTDKLAVHNSTDNNQGNAENNVYDHTDNCRTNRRSGDENYDTMGGIRSETEGIYDKSRQTIGFESQKLYSVGCETEGVYDNSVETNRVQVQNFVNDSLYESC